MVVQHEVAALHQCVVRRTCGAVEARDEPEDPVMHAAADGDRGGVLPALGELGHGGDEVSAHLVGLWNLHVMKRAVAFEARAEHVCQHWAGQAHEVDL